MSLKNTNRSEHYLAEIDGLRAVAVLGVIAFHASRIIPGGFVGVDIFFVISGFLISSIIFRDLDSSKFSLAKFWERRIKRILPAVTKNTSGFRKAVSKIPDQQFHLIDTKPLLFYQDGRSRVYENGRFLYYDNAHLSVHGARELLGKEISNWLDKVPRPNG